MHSTTTVYSCFKLYYNIRVFRVVKDDLACVWFKSPSICYIMVYKCRYRKVLCTAIKVNIDVYRPLCIVYTYICI